MIGTSSGDRVLLFLLHRAERSDRSGGKAGQDEISQFCGVGRTHVPRALKPLLGEELVKEELGRVPGVPRRVKVYSLTPKGMESAKGLRSSLFNRSVSWKDDNGEVRNESLSTVISEINSSLSGSGLRSIPLSLLLTLDGEMIVWNDVLWLSNSISREEGSSICLPEGWVPVEPPELPRDILSPEKGTHELEECLQRLGMAVVVGPRGSGKRTMLRWWAERSRRKVLWLVSSEEDTEVCIEEGAFDALVLIGSDMLDLGASVLVEGRAALKDPREEGWPDIFSDMFMIGVQEGELDMEAEGAVKVRGLDQDRFVRRLVDSGFPETLAHELYLAEKGSPGFMDYLCSLPRNEIEHISGSDPESAVIMLLMGYSQSRDNPKVSQKTHK